MLNLEITKKKSKTQKTTLIEFEDKRLPALGRPRKRLISPLYECPLAGMPSSTVIQIANFHPNHKIHNHGNVNVLPLTGSIYRDNIHKDAHKHSRFIYRGFHTRNIQDNYNIGASVLVLDLQNGVSILHTSYHS